MARSLIFQVPNDPQGRGYIIQALLINANYLPRRFAQLKLVAHFLEAGSKSFNLLLLPGYRRFLFLDFAVLFEELVQKHRVQPTRKPWIGSKKRLRSVLPGCQN